MTLHFTRTASTASFFPRQEAEKITFSSNGFSDILDCFSVKSNSVAAKTMKHKIKECEETGIEGEEKYCATSLESMTLAHLEMERIALQSPASYRITGVKMLCATSKTNSTLSSIATRDTTKPYLVSMAGEDGTK
ncbi:hypothetical protein NMG60_11027934 [Bertholletia excelsa]